MNMRIVAIAILSIAVMMSCNENKSMSSSVDQAQEDETKLEQGYRKAEIKKFDADDPCQYQIQLANSELLDPQELAEDFQKDGLEVWVKFLGQRRQSRCGRAQPVEVLEILKR